MDFQKLIPLDILQFLENVEDRTKGYDVYLGGGFLRDLYWNKLTGFGDWRNYYTGEGIDHQPMVPKDLDIFFIPKVNSKIHELPVIPKTYINYDIPAEDIPNVRENVKHVRGLFMKTLSVRDIQFIVYDKAMSMQGLAEDMDCSINQCMYQPSTGFSYVTNAFTNSHEDKVIEMMHEFEGERMFNRLNRMQAKFPDYKLKHNIPEEDWKLFEHKQLHSTSVRKRSGSSTGSFIED